MRKDGTRLWADVIIDLARNPAGEVVGFAKVTLDITQRALRVVTKDNDLAGGPSYCGSASISSDRMSAPFWATVIRSKCYRPLSSYSNS